MKKTSKQKQVRGSRGKNKNFKETNSLKLKTSKKRSLSMQENIDL